MSTLYAGGAVGSDHLTLAARLYADRQLLTGDERAHAAVLIRSLLARVAGRVEEDFGVRSGGDDQALLPGDEQPDDVAFTEPVAGELKPSRFAGGDDPVDLTENVNGVSIRELDLAASDQESGHDRNLTGPDNP